MYIEFINIPNSNVSVGKWLDFIIYLPTGEIGIQNVVVNKVIEPQKILEAKINLIENIKLKLFPSKLNTIYPITDGNKSLKITNLLYKDLTIEEGVSDFLYKQWVNPSTSQPINITGIIGWYI